MNTYDGGCHCGNLRVSFTTTLTPAQMEPRSCQCSFCIKHATGAVSDPAGSLTFVIKDPDQTHLYRLGSGITDFVICRTCGVYVGAHMPDDEGACGNVMAHVLDDHAAFTLASVPVVRTNENEDGRRARRRIGWTPSSIVNSTE
jgi:hypothetical protein